ncbi:hypothetical protein [Clostridium sp. YIM B02551]|uniref:hypothetical protein n=1 Tax=Clostridium sp. YIM B02551 TaxID=2910679 RepID=UPI001EE9AFB9|nr:hypothetical protein [Clostridium sp. YIM B02551]
MDKIKSKCIKYKGRKVIINICDYNNFGWNIFKYKRYICIFMSSNYNSKIKSKILHCAIKSKDIKNTYNNVGKF